VNQRYLLFPYLLLLSFFGGVIGLRTGEWYFYQSWIAENLGDSLRMFSRYAFVLLGTLVGLLMASLSFSKFQFVFSGVERAPFSDKVAGAVGLLFGAVVGAAFVGPLGKMPLGLKSAILILCSLLGISFGLSMKEEISGWFGRGRRTGGESDEGKSEAPAKLMDTNVIIDGRIADISSTRFVEGRLCVPQFILQELQSIADSENSLRRARGRRGLVMLARMQKELGTQVDVIEDYEINLDPSDPVDVRLVKLAKSMGASILTNDFNLNKVAELHGVTVLNVNELANALKPVFLPGEELSVEIVKPGKSPGQGVGYLDDGTMVVVDGAERMVGEELDCVVTSVLQTVAGKMIFAEIASGNGGRPRTEGLNGGSSSRPAPRRRSGR